MGNFLIVGTGAMATLFAARLSAAGFGITMLGSWQNGVVALRENGARLLDAHGVELSYPVHAVDNPADCQGAQYAFVLVKSWQTGGVAEHLAACLAGDGVALTLQNGLGNCEILQQRLGSSRVALGVTTTGSTLLGPGLARAGGDGVITLETHPRLGAMEAALIKSGFKVQYVKDARTPVWGKLVINAAINPLTALLGISNGELLQRSPARFLMRMLAQEAAAVAHARDIPLPFTDPVFAVEEVARITAANYSSMLQDLRRGAPTEIDAICGAIALAGEKLGVATPYNHAFWQLIKAYKPVTRGA